MLYGAPRAATIRAIEPTELIVISKEVYDKVIKRFQVDQIDQVVQFYTNLPTLTVSKEIILNMATKTKVLKVKSHSVFVKENDEVELIWFIRLGKCSVIKS